MKQKIVPVKTASWKEARKLTKDDGGLPSITLIEGPMGSREKRSFWAREVLVYPEKGGTFKKGEEVVDPNLPHFAIDADHIPEEAIGRKGIALLVVPAKVEWKMKGMEGLEFNPADFPEDPLFGNTYIHPKSITIITNFMQESGMGKIDGVTGIPIKTGDGEPENLAGEKMGELHRNDGPGVSPLYYKDGNVYANDPDGKGPFRSSQFTVWASYISE